MVADRDEVDQNGGRFSSKFHKTPFVFVGMASAILRVTSHQHKFDSSWCVKVQLH